jgi:hypothetical protein
MRLQRRDGRLEAKGCFLAQSCPTPSGEPTMVPEARLFGYHYGQIVAPPGRYHYGQIVAPPGQRRLSLQNGKSEISQ